VLEPSVKKASPEYDPRQVTVTDCVDDSHWLEYTRAGKPASGSGAAGRHHAEALVKKKHDGWRVTAWFIEKAGTC